MPAEHLKPLNQTLRNREQTGGWLPEEVDGRLSYMEVKEIKRYKLPVINKSQECNGQHKNIVNNTVITLNDDRWYLDLSWRSFCNV